MSETKVYCRNCYGDIHLIGDDAELTNEYKEVNDKIWVKVRFWYSQTETKYFNKIIKKYLIFNTNIVETISYQKIGYYYEWISEDNFIFETYFKCKE